MDTITSSMSALKGQGCKPTIMLEIGQYRHLLPESTKQCPQPQKSTAEPAPTAVRLSASPPPPPCRSLLQLMFPLPHTDT